MWPCVIGPDFVRKHIFNKHAEKIEEVRKEVEFFNNYLQDPKRPMLAEPAQPKREEQPTYNHPQYVYKTRTVICINYCFKLETFQTLRKYIRFIRPAALLQSRLPAKT